MKIWNEAEIVELNINETAQGREGGHYDGGYLGDGHFGLQTTEPGPDCNCTSCKNTDWSNTPDDLS